MKGKYLNFTPVNSPRARDTKDESPCEYLQSVELHITELDWSLLMRNMDTERDLTECESKCLGRSDAVQFGRKFYVTAQS